MTIEAIKRNIEKQGFNCVVARETTDYLLINFVTFQCAFTIDSPDVVCIEYTCKYAGKLCELTFKSDVANAVDLVKRIALSLVHVSVQ